MKTDFKMSVAADWLEIDNVYTASNKFFSSFNFDSNNVDRATMVTCELVENAIKYGNFEKNKTVDVVVKIKKKKVTIIVKNPIGKKSETYLRELDKTVQWIRGFQNSYEAYIERMKKISTEPMSYLKSELGIVRITYEGQAIIDFFIQEEKMLNVSAVLELK